MLRSYTYDPCATHSILTTSPFLGFGGNSLGNPLNIVGSCSLDAGKNTQNYNTSSHCKLTLLLLYTTFVKRIIHKLMCSNAHIL